MTSAPPGLARPTRDRLVGLLDYIEQVVRLDERVAFTLADYRMPDGRAAAFPVADLAGLPGVALDAQDEAGALWLSMERLARAAPPAPPEDLGPWLTVGTDPERAPAIHAERVVEVDEAGRAARIAAGACPSAFVPVPAEDGAPPRFQQTLRLADQRSTESRLSGWIRDVWVPWAAAERPRRRAIATYERLYRLQQLRETGGAEAPVELVWGIGMARWRRGGRVLERPLIERAVDLELDEGDGTLRVRPTTAAPAVDLKPYDELGCAGLPLLDDAIRRAFAPAEGGEGVSPFRRDSFEPVLALAAARLDPDAAYGSAAEAPEAPTGVLHIDDASVLFARPRSAHVLLADIERLRVAAREPEGTLGPLATRLVTEPAAEAGGAWAPLSDRLGESAAPAPADGPEGLDGEVFFPKPFNDDQMAIARRLARGEGLVVQGPPGTGKTHTIANLVCHAMATGQRVLVTSRGEAALAVLRDQLPDKVRSLAIALLSSEREGLGQVEGAIRAVQGAVEGSRPDIRHAAIRRCEAEIVRRRARLAAVDADLDALGEAQAARVGPRAETPAELALRVAGLRDAFAWFTDRPSRYAAEAGLAEPDLSALRAARRAAGDLLDHRDAALPPPAALPDAETVAGWHAVLVRAAAQPTGGEAPGPWGTLHLGPGEAQAGEQLAAALDGLAALLDGLPAGAWFRPFCAPAPPGRWAPALAALLTDWERLDAGRVEALGLAVELPPGLADDRDAREAVGRGARGERPWPVLALGKAAGKALLGAVRVRGAPVAERDAAAWAAVEARLALADRRRDVEARWRALAADAGAPLPATAAELATVAEAARLTAAAAAARANLTAGRLPALTALGTASDACRALAAALRGAAEVAAGEAVREAVARLRLRFESEGHRASAMACRILDGPLGQPGLEAARVAAAWNGLLGLLGRLRDLREAFATVGAVTGAIRAAGAPAWAARLATEPPGPDGDALLPPGWRDVWDLAAADAHLARLDARERLGSLARERAEEERGVERLFGELVRERTFYALERRLSPSVKSALVEFVRALGRLGKGTGRNAAHQRRLARDAMRRCYAAVPCWIMPTWRVSEQLPATLAAFDLVILDEASQSDVTELPALLRGRKVLVVGDDRQVSPTAPFIPQARIEALRARHLRGLPFAGLLAPGESLYTLMQAVFPEEQLMLREHFRCAEPIIRFSMGFYPEPLVPLRVPSAAERLDPPLVDIYVPHGARAGARKVNPAEAQVVVEEVAAFLAEPGNARRSVGVISLVGADQAELIRTQLEERLGAELMQRHAILCGDSATFQGNERDVVFLSMVADRRHRQALTMSRYEQRFNVAMSRARDRVVLVRSVAPQDLNPADLKARLIAHFAQPMPSLGPSGADDPLELCESGFERDVMGRLLALGYAVTPQVGALGFRIDLVVEGEGGRRLAVECDGDRFHGPGRWREDMRRQRVLERVGWRFWRCFASSFHADPDGVMADLVDTLTRFGIAPRPTGVPTGPSPYVSHRVAPPPPVEPAPDAQGELALNAAPPRGAAVGDRILLTFADDRRTASVLLTAGEEDLSRGLVSAASPLGATLAGREEEDEVDLPFETGMRRALVERVERLRTPG